MRRFSPALLIVLAAGPLAATPRPLSIGDLALLADVAEPAFSPDGEYLTYTVTTTNVAEDLQQSDLWRVRWDGSDRRALTHTVKESEWQAQWSADGKWIAFLSDRGGEDAKTQVWIMPAFGGEPRKLTSFPDGVAEYALAPDGTRLAVIAGDPERPEGEAAPKNPPPIVSSRYQFKEDGTGYLGTRRKHLHLFDIATSKATLLTPGDHQEGAPSWSPDGKRIAYVTKRGPDPDRHLNFDIYVIEAREGAAERQLTTFLGGDLDPDWGSRPEWSPDGKRIAYVQGGEDRWIYYAPFQLAVVDVDSGESRRVAPIDRWFYRPRWSPDGRSLLALIEHSRSTWLSRIDAASGEVTPLTRGARFDADFAVGPKGRIAVLGGTDLTPPEISAVGVRGRLRGLASHNGFLAERRLAPVEPITFSSEDGTSIDGFLVKPIDYEPGKRYPTILRIHGGPVYQFSHEFMADWQLYAAQGYAVVAANPRGSSGRGFEFARAIYADWGNKDVEDVLAAVDHVVELGVADPARLGLGGWSYGSMLTNYTIASDTRFKAAIAGAGTSNMLGNFGHDQYIREYELEIGTPWKNRDRYERVSYPFLRADRIVTPTLFQCASADFNMPCLGAEQMYQALRVLNVESELVIYPDENHSLKVPSYVRDRMERNLAWYGRFLQSLPR
jgi:dipeptidyl aminopeptidase/acylaminoacyl peptidase